MHVRHHTLHTDDGWSLVAHRGVPDDRPPSGPPVLFVHGFGMNSTLFRTHPTGLSFMEFLHQAGFDPWSLDTRGTRSSSHRGRRDRPIQLVDQAVHDLSAAIQHIRDTTGHDRVHAIGCSLGGLLFYLHTALVPTHRVNALVTMGTPLVWRRSLIGTGFRALSPVLATVPMRGTRAIARYGLPVARTVAPWALRIYLNTAITDTQDPTELIHTVENPIPSINAEIAAWIRDRHFPLPGTNLTDALGEVTAPLMVVWGDGDGVCPPSAARAAVGATGGPSMDLGIRHPSGHPVSHADLFICEGAQSLIYTPVADFLRDPHGACATPNPPGA